MQDGIRYCSLPYQDIYYKLWSESRAGSYISYLRGKRCQTDEDFFCEISASFQFPAYFGENWNALNDCLGDLDWLHFSKIMIVLDDYSLAYSNDTEGKQLLLKSLVLMAKRWKQKNMDIEIWLNN